MTKGQDLMNKPHVEMRRLDMLIGDALDRSQMSVLRKHLIAASEITRSLELYDTDILLRSAQKRCTSEALENLYCELDDT